MQVEQFLLHLLKILNQQFILSAIAFLALFFFTPTAFSSALADENTYISIGYLKPTTAFGGSYYSYKSDGSANIKFFDPADQQSEKPFPLIALGLRLSENIWLGADYLSMEGDSDGKIGKRVRFGPFRLFITAPIQEHYQFDIGRLWLGYRLINKKEENLILQLGLSAIRAKATAKVEELGQESEEGTLPMPMIGFQVNQSGPYSTKWTLSADYSHIEVNDLFGRATNLSASVEKALDFGFSIGLGYKQYDFNVKVHRTKYNAELQQKIAGPFVFIQHSF